MPKLTISDETKFRKPAFDKPLVLSHLPGEQDLSVIQSNAGASLFYSHKGEADEILDPANIHGRITRGAINDLALNLEFDWSKVNPSTTLIRNQVEAGELKGASVRAAFRRDQMTDMGDHYRVKGWRFLGASLTPMPEIATVGLSADTEDEFTIALSAAIMPDDDNSADVIDLSTETQVDNSAQTEADTMTPEEIQALQEAMTAAVAAGFAAQAEAMKPADPAESQPNAGDPGPETIDNSAEPTKAPVDNRPQIQAYSQMALTNPTLDVKKIYELTNAAMVANQDPAEFAEALKGDDVKKAINQNSHVAPDWSKDGKTQAEPISMGLAADFLQQPVWEQVSNSKYDDLRAFSDKINAMAGRRGGLYIPFDQSMGLGDQSGNDHYVIQNLAGDPNNFATANEGGNAIESRRLAYIGQRWDPYVADIINMATTLTPQGAGKQFVTHITVQPARDAAEPTTAAGYTRGEPHGSSQTSLTPHNLIWDMQETRLLDMQSGGTWSPQVAAEGRMAMGEKLGYNFQGALNSNSDSSYAHRVSGVYQSASANANQIAAGTKHPTVKQLTDMVGKFREANVGGTITFYCSPEAFELLKQEVLVTGVTPFMDSVALSVSPAGIVTAAMADRGGFRVVPTSNNFDTNPAVEKARSIMVENESLMWLPWDNAIYVAPAVDIDGIRSIRFEQWHSLIFRDTHGLARFSLSG